WGYLRQVREQYGVTIVLTTHYLEEAEQADRLCILNHGRIVAMGTPGEIKERREEEYLELDAEDRGRLRTELTQMNLRFDEDAMFTVKLDGRSAHDVIKALDVPLTRLRTRQPSLEDAYLRILADE
ncbi:MAG TPA: ABC transporter ATP-binding protein, partial [Candidatus Dormibacteraeota bacterium]|nr:ABC transporter ATP-binding protein [Candidatus Dormibacteraeota bacterium]